MYFFLVICVACGEAYDVEKFKKEHCFRGCNEMMTLQAKAPLINGWLVYMGATDRNMVLLQPDFDIPSKEDWVLLDSMLRANDYDYSQYGGYDKITTQIETVPHYMERDHFTINFCIPMWMWMLPLFLLVAFLYIHYSNYIYGIFLSESLQHEFGLVGPNQVNGVPIDITCGEEKKCLRPSQEFAVGSDFYFYPAPVVPPPKYNEIAESILMDSSDDENDTAACIPACQNKSNPTIITTAKKNSGNDQRNSVVDIWNRLSERSNLYFRGANLCAMKSIPSA